MKRKLIFLFMFIGIKAHQLALVAVPVADLAGQPLATFYKNKKLPIRAYHELPWSAVGSSHCDVCPRVHQALFNEVVELIEIRGQEARIRLPNIYYITSTNQQPQRDYWVLRNSIVTYGELKRMGIDIKKIPKPIDYQSKNPQETTSNTVTLTQPFYDPATQQTFSAGTRFVKTSKQPSKLTVSVYLFDRKKKKMAIATIPQIALYVSASQSNNQRIQDFLQILRTWATSLGTIPYVWGGCSLTHFHHDSSFEKKPVTPNNAVIVRPAEHESSKGGLDCSGLILRAAQIVGIPYFYKNSYTIASQLQPLLAHESLQEGDIIWIFGHVMVVASLQKNTVIEAASYEGGYGKIQEISLNKLFKDIQTFDDLMHAHHKKTKIYRLNKEGNIMGPYRTVKLLKLASVWQ